MSDTLDYYNKHAEEYCRDTFDADMSYPLQRFTFYLHTGDRVLDAGCGSGRDTLWFIRKGYRTEAMDGSQMVASIASKNTGIPVKVMTFNDIDAESIYDGIFASASLLHVPYEEMEMTFERLFRALKKEGILYASFQYGSTSGYRGERYYTDMNEERLLDVMKDHLDEWTVLELWHSHDVLNRDKLWFNMILRRIR